MSYYAVKCGITPGIYKTWDECKQQVKGFKNPIFKKFSTMEQAQLFINNKLDIIPIKLYPKLKLDVFNKDNDYNPTLWTQINNQYYIFTDGSYHSSNKKSGIGIYMGINALNIGEYYEGLTNNQCELLSILYTLQIIIKYYNYLSNKIINIVSDSEYSINCITKWMKNWIKNNWKTKTGDDVKNKNIISNCDKYLSHLSKLNNETNTNVQIKFIHIRSHQNTPSNIKSLEYIMWQGNFYADLIANGTINTF